MNYEFPIIKNLDDVLPSLKDRDDFKIMDKGDYIVIDYVYTQPDSFDCHIRRECRGIVFDAKTGDIINRRFQKFFNLGEREETQPFNLDLTKPHNVFVKADGSMISPCIINNELVFMTRKGVTDVALQAMAESNLSPVQKDWMVNCLADNLTPIYEFVSPNNRIVVEYEKPELILLAVRDNISGKYLPIHGEQIKTNISFSDPHSIRDAIKDMTGIEGFVIRFADGHMIKIKTDEYLRLHRTIDVFESEKNILQVILNQETDDLYPMLKERKAERLRKFEFMVNDAISLKACTVFEAINLWKDKDQKDFALTVQKELPKHYWPLMFAARKSKDNIYDIVRNHLLRFCTSATKIEEMREPFLNGLAWENYK